VAERVPSNALRDSSLRRSGTNESAHEGLPPIWSSATSGWACEHPIIRRPIPRMLAPLQESFRKIRVERNRFL
jgi:hypothetical protein